MKETMKVHILCYILGLLVVAILFFIHMDVFKPNFIINIISVTENAKQEPPRPNSDKIRQTMDDNIIIVKLGSSCGRKWCKKPTEEQRIKDTQNKQNKSNASFFPMRNSSRVARSLADVQELLDPLLCRLELERGRILDHVRDWRLDTEKSRTLVRASDQGYFKILRRIPSVRTLILEVPVTMVTDAVGDEEFQWTGSDCSLIEDTFNYQNQDNSHHGNGHHSNSYHNNYTCQSDISESVVARKVEPDALEVQGLEEAPNLRRKRFSKPRVITTVTSSNVSVTSSNVSVTYIHVTTNALVNSVGKILTNDVILETSGCPIPKKESGRSSSRPVHEYPMYKELFVVSQVWKGYYHIVIEQMTRLAPYICFLKRTSSVKIHMNIAAGMMGVVKEYFQILGLSSSRIVTGSTRAQVVYIPTGTPCTKPSMFNTRLLSLWLRSRLPENPAPRTSIVLIKRKEGWRRWFKNHNSIRKRLFDLTRVNDEFILEELSDPVPPLKQVMQLFNRASLVAAPHGAGLSNVLFSEPGTVVIESLCRVAITAYSFRNLATVLGHRYHGVFTPQSCLDTTPQMLSGSVERYMYEARKFNNSSKVN